MDDNIQKNVILSGAKNLLFPLEAKQQILRSAQSLPSNALIGG